MPIDPFRHQTSPAKESSFPWVLVISLALNVAFISYTIFQWQDGTLWLEVESQKTPALLPPVEDATLEDEIAKLATKKDEELLSDLDDATPAANGYRTQELALALLRSRGYQVEDPLRPLRAWPQALTPFSYHTPDGTSITIYLFSTLSPADIHAVRTYIEQTPVPFTSEKIVERLSTQEDITLLKAALIRTDEWATVRTLFPSGSEDDLVALCKEIGPTGFTELVTKKDPSALFSQHPSKMVADFLVAAQPDVLLKAPDPFLIALLPLLNPKSENTVRFALSLLKEQRKPPVWQAAQAVLALSTNNPSLATLSREELFARITPQKPKTPPPPPPQPEKKPSPPPSSTPSRIAARQLRPYRTYIVKKGDTLWSIAKRFNVDVDKLKYLNHLKGTELAQGKELRIPH